MIPKVRKMKLSSKGYFPPRSKTSIKPEDDDEEAKRRMDDEMRGLMCGTSPDNPYDLDDTASEEESSFRPTQRRPPIESLGKHYSSSPTLKRTPSIEYTLTQAKNNPLPSGATCNVCTTFHPTPIPTCCESCNNVLQPDNLDDRHKWTCEQEGCFGRETGYVNIIDTGRCGLCGVRRASMDI